MQCIILIGLQASGKSTFAREQFSESHTIIRRDDFRHNKRPARRELNLLREELQSKRTVVCDGVHAERVKRANLIELAQEFQYQVIGYYFESIVQDCRSRNAKRTGQEIVPEVALYSTINVLERPQFDEGFDDLFFVRMNQPTGFEVLPWCDEQQESECDEAE